jgi:DNA-binding MarR family transcriptional regulator/GNAT superfamily N-acetyltransferase
MLGSLLELQSVVRYNYVFWRFCVSVPPSLIGKVRSASRQLVRELGFMGGGHFAGTDLTPSAVHALIEIEAGEGITAKELGERLHLEKSTVSRMLDKLVLSGNVKVNREAKDARTKRLSLSTTGRKRVTEIHAFACAQVSRALSKLTVAERWDVLKGLQLYAGAFTAKRSIESAAAPLHIVYGYHPGVIAKIIEMHAVYYSREAAFGKKFELKVAAGLADFCERLEKPMNGIWTAQQGGIVVGSVALDGEDLGVGVSHLRWFIVDDGARGAGVGRKLLDAALRFSDDRGFREIQLWTFDGLHAARHLYESRGFTLVEERPGRRWGRKVLEQRFSRACHR